MPIRIAVRDNLNCPVVYCDQCQHEIKTAKEGNYEWEYSENGASEIFFTHKGCSNAFRNAHPEIAMSEELMMLPLYLNNCLEIDPEEALRSANMAQQL